MIQRTCLIIDDDDQSDIFTLIQKEGLKYQLNINCIQFNIGNPSEIEILKEQVVDKELVIEVFKNRFTNIKIDLIAVDWDLNNSVLTGPLFIKLLNDNNEREKIPKMLYSGVLKSEIEKICNEFKANRKGFNEIWNEINTLIVTDIRTFVNRDVYNGEVVQQLRKVEDTFDSSVEMILRSFPDFSFRPSFLNGSYKNRSFGEILKMVEKEPNLKSELNREISNQVVAYLTKNI